MKNENRIKIQLEDLENSMQYKILETASDKKEIEIIARKRGLVVPSPDIALFKGIYLAADKFNRNGSMLSSKEIAKALDTLILKPVTHNHREKEIIGIVLDAEFNDNEVIVYGAIFRDNYGKAYASIKNDFENGDVGLSYELYGDKIPQGNGKYSWNDVFFCGCGMLDKGIRPACDGAKVKEFAMVKEVGADVPLTVCKNCDFRFDLSTIKPEENGSIKCPSCKEILGLKDNTEPTSDLNCSCPNCGNSGDTCWDNVYDYKTNIVATCTSCKKTYEFEIEELNKDIPKLGINIAFEAKASCPQCGNTIKYPVWANKEKTPLICKRCGLKFIHRRKVNYAKYIVKSIMEFKEENMNELQKAFASVEKVEDVTEVMLQSFKSASDEDKASLDEKVKEIAQEAIQAKEDLAKTDAKKEKNIAYQETMKRGIRKLALEVMNLKEDVKVVNEYEKELASVKENHVKEIASVVEKKEKEIAQVKLDYKEQAKTIYNRKEELGEYAEAMTDIEILNEDKYTIAKLKKEVASKKIKEDAAVKPEDNLELGTQETPEVKTEQEKEVATYNEKLVKAHEKEMNSRKIKNKK